MPSGPPGGIALPAVNLPTVLVDVPDSDVHTEHRATESSWSKWRSSLSAGIGDIGKRLTLAPGAAIGAIAELPEVAQEAIKDGLLSSITSGLVCGLLIFVFCCVFSEMIFGQNELLQSAVPLGVGTQTMTAMIGAFAFARFSGCRAVVAGPDINPIVFLAEAAGTISETICPDGLDASCDKAHKAVPTVMVSMMVATLLVGVSFWLLGRLRMTAIVGFIPSHVVSGFLSCIGWKVLKASFEVASPYGKSFKTKYIEYFFGSWEKSWMFILPALPIGIPLYLLKRYHIGKPTVNFPLFIIGPAVIFYVALAAQGMSLETAREIGWLFEPERGRNDFWVQWGELYGSMGDVHWEALPGCFPTWLVMLLIVNLDNMLKLASTESAISVDFDYNHEMIVGGASTVVAALLGGSPAYSQTKFNVLNYAMTHSTTSALPSCVVGFFCGALFFSGAPLINYLPRFMLSGLLVFSAVGFLVENLWDSRTKFQRLNFAAIWAVFLINVVMSELLPQFGLLIAIVSGLVFGLFSFAVHFARKSITTESIPGEQHCSTAIRSASQEAKLGVLGVWYHIFAAQGYIFFGTASKLHRMFKQHVQDIGKRPRAERTRYLILDLSKVNGMDETAGVVFSKIARLASASGNIQLVWAGAAETVARRLERQGLLAAGNSRRSFATLDAAEKWVEDTLLQHVHELSLKWLVDKTCRQVYTRAVLHDALTSASSAGGMGASQLLRWCTPEANGDEAAASEASGGAARKLVSKGHQVLKEGHEDDALYLLYRGLVEVREGATPHTIYPGAFFNEHVMYSAADAGALYTATAVEDSVILRISGRQRELMQEQNPHDSYQLLLSVFRQIEMRNPARRHHTWVDDGEDSDDAQNSSSRRPSRISLGSSGATSGRISASGRDSVAKRPHSHVDLVANSWQRSCAHPKAACRRSHRACHRAPSPCPAFTHSGAGKPRARRCPLPSSSTSRCCPLPAPLLPPPPPLGRPPPLPPSLPVRSGRRPSRCGAAREEARRPTLAMRSPRETRACAARWRARSRAARAAVSTRMWRNQASRSSAFRRSVSVQKAPPTAKTRRSRTAPPTCPIAMGRRRWGRCASAGRRASTGSAVPTITTRRRTTTTTASPRCSTPSSSTATTSRRR